MAYIDFNKVLICACVAAASATLRNTNSFASTFPNNNEAPFAPTVKPPIFPAPASPVVGALPSIRSDDEAPLKMAVATPNVFSTKPVFGATGVPAEMSSVGDAVVCTNSPVATDAPSNKALRIVQVGCLITA